MAARRMFSLAITDDDVFTELPATAQAAYLHLCMGADDDGVIHGLRAQVFKAQGSADDIDALNNAGYIITLPTGVTVIKHWRMQNEIKKDRYKPSSYQDRLIEAGLLVKDNGVYSLTDGTPFEDYIKKYRKEKGENAE